MALLKLIRYLAWAAIAVVAVAAIYVASGGRTGRLDSGQLPLSAAIGGPFALTTHDGQRVTERAFLGKPFLLFFGFTNCPDVCPTTLLEISNRLAELGTDGDKLRVLFVTVDPEADTPEHLKRYIANFDKRIIGLTGSADDIAEVARRYRAIYKKVASKDGYTMDHTATVYLMDAKGQFAGTIAYQENASVQLGKLKKLIN